MNTRSFRANILLLLTALIWGSAFVAQRVGMDHMGPLLFNGARFALGSLALIPLILRMRAGLSPDTELLPRPTIIRHGIILGCALFLGSWLQQFGLCYTTAGNAGFITGLYVVFVPLIGLFLKQRYGMGTWIGSAMAVSGMYLLSVTEGFSISKGDFLVLVSALFWAVHVLLIGRFSDGIRAVDAVRISAVQFGACAAISLAAALVFEPVSLTALKNGMAPILYGGLMSVGIAYTLQVVAQRDASPAPAAIILSMEAVFAALAGWLFLEEIMTVRAIMGCGLMLGGMILAQVKP
jgi:drug/metabolite transporter (DMT)-like permease